MPQATHLKVRKLGPLQEPRRTSRQDEGCWVGMAGPVGGRSGGKRSEMKLERDRSRCKLYSKGNDLVRIAF